MTLPTFLWSKSKRPRPPAIAGEMDRAVGEGDVELESPNGLDNGGFIFD